MAILWSRSVTTFELTFRSSTCNLSGPGDLFDLSDFKAASNSHLSGGGLGSNEKIIKFLGMAGLRLIGGLNFS